MQNLRRLGLLAGLSLLLSACGRSEPVSRGSSAEDGSTPRTRYAFANRCMVLRSLATGRFVRRDGSGYVADVEAMAGAEPFFLKPAALGDYLLYHRGGELLAAGSSLSGQTLGSANDAAIWTLRGVGDNTAYPPAPQVEVEPTPEALQAYRSFVDPNYRATRFTLRSHDGRFLAADGPRQLRLDIGGAADRAQFALVEAAGCAAFPEMGSNTEGQTFRGRLPDGRVLGIADAHTHITAGNYGGNAVHGRSFHRFGVTHALDDCAVTHGPSGARDVVSTAFNLPAVGHATDGWPTFSAWPSPVLFTHNGTYWKWLERSWIAGLRLLVNHTVENEALCAVGRLAYGGGDRISSCDETDRAMSQVGSSYAMQDYIDAQYGGRGAGFWRVVESPAEARRVIADGTLAVVLGLEISHAFNCKLNYRRPQETGTPESENVYGCSMDETADNALVRQLDRAHALGIRSVFATHEYDNAFAGNGIFTPILNFFNRIDTGSIDPVGTHAVEDILAGTAESPSGEFWSTYDCPQPEDPKVGGYLYHPGANLIAVPPGVPQAACLLADPDGRPGGRLACYSGDAQRPQCNARWMTPIGLYLMKKLMERGVIVELDHMELEVKNQVLDLAEAQRPVYPTVSGHSGDPLSYDHQLIAHGGLSNIQARRVLAGGGLISPMKRNAPRMIELHRQIKELYRSSGSKYLFGFGYGSDTNSPAVQAKAREQIQPGQEVRYPFTLFKGPTFDDIPEFRKIAPVTFQAASARDAQGRGREWHIDEDGQGHNGLFADGVEELRQEGDAETLRDLYLSAENYLQMWERTEAAGRGVARNGFKLPDGLLRSPPAP